MARHQLRLHRVHVRRAHRRTHQQTVRLERLRVEVSVERLVRAGLVSSTANGHHVRIRARRTHRARQRERAGRLRHVRVRPHSHAVDVRARTTQLIRHCRGKHRRRRVVVVRSSEVEDVPGIRAARRRHRHRVRVHVTLRVLHDRRRRSHRRHVRVEVHRRARRARGEVQLHSQHAVPSLDLGRRTNHTMVTVRLIRAVRSRRRTHHTISHVVAEHLHAVHVQNHTELVVQLHLVCRHIRNPSERLAEVLTARCRCRHRTQRHRAPTTLAEVHRVPVRRDRPTRRSHLPLHALHHGVVQRQRELLLALLHQRRLQHHVTVDAGHAHPRTVRPRITIRVDDLERVLVVRRRRQTVLVRALLVVRKRSARLQLRRPVQNLVRLLRSPRHALLRHRHVHLAVVTRQRAHRNRHCVSHTLHTHTQQCY